MFEQAELHKEDGKWQSVFGLDVLPEHRRKGYAGQLMRALIEHSREDGRCGCILTCKEHLLPYYTRFGFRNLGVSLSQHGGAAAEKLKPFVRRPIVYTWNQGKFEKSSTSL